MSTEGEGRRNQGPGVAWGVLALIALVVGACGGSSTRPTAPPHPTPASSSAASQPASDRPSSSEQSAATPLSSTPAPTSAGPPIPAITPGLVDLGLIGTWGHHGFTLTIQPDGSGIATWRTYQTCAAGTPPPCDQISDNEIIDGGRATFTIRALPQSSNAIATITSSTDHSTLGAPGTVQVSPVLGRSGPGREIVFPIVPNPTFVLCDAAAGVTGDCGA